MSCGIAEERKAPSVEDHLGTSLERGRFGQAHVLTEAVIDVRLRRRPPLTPLRGGALREIARRKQGRYRTRLLRPIASGNYESRRQQRNGEGERPPSPYRSRSSRRTWRSGWPTWRSSRPGEAVPAFYASGRRSAAPSVPGRRNLGLPATSPRPLSLGGWRFVGGGVAAGRARPTETGRHATARAEPRAVPHGRHSSLRPGPSPKFA